MTLKIRVSRRPADPSKLQLKGLLRSATLEGFVSWRRLLLSDHPSSEGNSHHLLLRHANLNSAESLACVGDIDRGQLGRNIWKQTCSTKLLRRTTSENVPL